MVFMKRCLTAFIAFTLGISAQGIAQGDYEARVKEYISKYRVLAMQEQKRSGIPASITLAQGIHETQAGASELATQANNHFGIKCKKNWTGETFAHTDDAPDECFRKYARAEDSYRDHSEYLSKTPRYADLFKLSATDYAAWAIGLKRAGYATNPKYPQVLIKLVEDYRLQEYTYAAMDNDLGDNIAKEVVPEHDAAPVVTAPINKVPVETTAPVVAPVATAAAMPPYGQVIRINGLKAVFARKGDMPLEYAIRNNVRYERLLEINEIDEKPVAQDMFIYLERKNFRGIRATHEVKEGETVMQIAQLEGVQSKSIRLLNKLELGEEPLVGTMLELQKPAVIKPALAGEGKTTVPSTAATAAVTAEPVVVPQEVDPAPVKTPEVVAEPVTKQPVSEPAVEQVTTTNAVPEPTAVITQPVSEPVAQQPQTENNTPAVAITPIAETNTVTTTPSAPVEVGPPSSPTDIPEKSVIDRTKRIETPKQAPVLTKTPEQPKVEEPKTEEPKSELDILKSKFDKVVYSKPVVKEEPKPATAEPQTTQPAQPVTEHPVVASGAPKYHVVKKGETAFSIAKTYNLTVRELQEMNGLDFSEIKVGQKLKVK